MLSLDCSGHVTWWHVHKGSVHVTWQDFSVFASDAGQCRENGSATRTGTGSEGVCPGTVHYYNV